MKRECTEAENHIIKDSRADILTDPKWYFILPKDKFWVNGGTVLEYKNYQKEDASLIFAEDDLRDAIHRPCCVEYPVLPNLDIHPGERILLLYGKSGAYMQMRVTESTRNWISMQRPEYFEKVDWKTAKTLPHPAVLELDRKSHLMGKEEKAALCKKRSISKWIRIKKLHKLQYQKKVMFLFMGSTYANNKYLKNAISVYEYVHGNIKVMSYPIKGNIFLPKKICCGSVIYKYFNKVDNNEESVCFSVPD